MGPVTAAAAGGNSLSICSCFCPLASRTDYRRCSEWRRWQLCVCTVTHEFLTD